MASELTGVKTHVIVQDLSKLTTFADYKELADKIPADFDIALLLCNAGVSQFGGFMQAYEKTGDEDQINVNSLHPVYLNKALLPRMLQRSQKSGIINVSSVAHLTPVPGLALYDASKVFINYFTQAVAFELKADGTNIDMMEYSPSLVYTKLSLLRGGFFAISAEEAACQSLDDLGNTTYTNGPLKHAVRAWMMRTMIYYFQASIFKSQHKANKDFFTFQ